MTQQRYILSIYSHKQSEEESYIFFFFYKKRFSHLSKDWIYEPKVLDLQLMDEIRQKYITINKQIFNLRDGEVLQMQQEYGAKHKKSLGVPIISLENLAKRHKASHEVSKLLWEFGGREQTLVAAMLEEPEKVEIKELEAYLLQTHTPELWEQITRQLLRRLPFIANHITNWLNRKEEVLHIFAVLSLGYLPEFFSEELLQQIMQLQVNEASYLHKCIQRVFLKIGIRNKSAFLLMKQNVKIRSYYSSILTDIADFYA